MQPFTDMAQTEDDKVDTGLAGHLLGEDGPKYPYGLKINLTEKEIEKLGVDTSDWKPGDVFQLHALAKVVGTHESEREGGNKCCNVEMQITHLAADSEDEGEDEEEHEPDEAEEPEPKKPVRRSNNYF